MLIAYLVEGNSVCVDVDALFLHGRKDLFTLQSRLLAQ
jgi:hypothetical protein